MDRVRARRGREIGDWCGAASARLNRWVEWLCAAILATMIIDVGIGVFGRYVIELPVTWSEELARYLMIWAALLAVSCGAARREHVAVTALFDALPPGPKRLAAAVFDGLGFALFAFLGFFGVGMTMQGATQFTTVFDMSMQIPFAAVPVAAAVACVQIALVGLRDFLAAGRMSGVALPGPTR